MVQASTAIIRGGSGYGVAALSFCEALLLTAWLGSMLFFSFAVAPSAFSSLPSRALAGLLVASALSKVEFLGLVAGPLLMLIGLLKWNAGSSGKSHRFARLLLLAVMTACAALSHFLITPAMASIRNSIPGLIDNVPAGDPLRTQFDQLHQYSVWAMAAAMFAGMIVLFLTVQGQRRL